MKTTVKVTRKTPDTTVALDKALRTKSSRQDALDIITIRERKNEPRLSAEEVFQIAGL